MPSKTILYPTGQTSGIREDSIEIRNEIAQRHGLRSGEDVPPALLAHLQREELALGNDEEEASDDLE